MMRPDVVVLGSLHMDVIADAPRLPRPGETLPGTRMAVACGGKGGNQAMAAARHGANVAMIGCLGPDDFGRHLRANLRAAGVDVSCVREVDQTSGASVAIADSAGEYGAVIISGANLLLESADVAAAGLLIEGARVLVLQNEVPEAANLAAARRAAQAGVTVVFNAAPARPIRDDLAGTLDVLVVNAVEAEMLGAGEVVTLADAQRAAHILSGRVKTAIVTAGGAGMAAHVGQTGFALPAHCVTVVSMHGAGDTFVGALAVRLARGDRLQDAARYANAAAGLAVATQAADRGRVQPDDVFRLADMLTGNGCQMIG